MLSLRDKKALVTGASGGLGEEIARTLHRQGASVVLSGTRREKLENLVKDLGTRAFACPCDLSKHEDTALLIQKAENLLGGLDILVNNAGLTQDNLMIRMSNGEWSRVIDVNLTSTFILCREATKIMMKQRFGRLINITSVVGIGGNRGQANYAASKAGVIGLSKSLALEVATRGITVNCIAPGFIESPMTSALTEKQREQILENIPMKTIGLPQDIAAGVAYLASDEARYITGQTLHINGGMLRV